MTSPTKLPWLVMSLAAVLIAAGCGGSDDSPAPAAPPAVPADVAVLGADLVVPAAAGAPAADPLADLAELAPSDTSATEAFPPELLPPA
jgi:hypothetical protein